MKILLTGGTLNPLKSTYETALGRMGHTTRVCYPADPMPDPADFDGLLLTGGVDIHPARFGCDPLPNGSETFDLLRDEREFALVALFMAAQKSIMGICRGMQVINIALGGDIWQDLPSQAGHVHAAARDKPPLYHSICWTVGRRQQVNSYHHQAVRTCAPCLRIAARAPDGITEALIHPDYPLRAVQWHPELMEEGLQWLVI